MTGADGKSWSVPYIVMEYVEGHTVRDLLGNGSALPIDEAIEITNGVLDALEYSHHSGIVHRDIKPANVMITPTGAVKVMDFGIARALSDTSTTMTQTHAVVGTAQYLSPEQARGEAVDARSDLYSTGCLLYELLTGRPPFTGDSAVAVAYQHVGEQAPLPSSIAPDVPEVLDRITMKALTKERERRYSSAAVFRSDLNAAATSGIVSAPAVAAAPTKVLSNQFPPVNATPNGYSTGGFPATGSQLNAAEQTHLLDSYEEEPEPKSRAWLWVLLVALLIGGLVAAYILMNRETPDPGPELVAVPSLSEGMSQDEVNRLLTDAQLVAEIQDPIPSADVAKDTLVQWEPNSGEVEVGSAIQVWYSSGPGEAIMPDVTGMRIDQAKNALGDRGFDLANIDQESEDRPEVKKDIVFSANLEAGESYPIDSDIVLTVGTGNLEVPDVRGERLDVAISQLEDLGLNVRTEPVPTTDEAPGMVLTQNGMGLRPVDSDVYLEYSVEPEETPSPEPTEEPTTPEPTEPAPTETTTPPEETEPPVTDPTADPTED